MGKRNRLKQILDERGTKHAWVAEKAGVSRATMSELVQQKREPTLATARRIAKVLECDVDDIWPHDE